MAWGVYEGVERCQYSWELTLILKPGPASRPEPHRKLKEGGEGDSKVMNWFLVVKLRFQRLVYLFVELSYPLEVILL